MATLLYLAAALLLLCVRAVAGEPSVAGGSAVDGSCSGMLLQATGVLAAAVIPPAAGVPAVTRPCLYWHPFDADMSATGVNVAGVPDIILTLTVVSIILLVTE